MNKKTKIHGRIEEGEFIDTDDLLEPVRASFESAISGLESALLFNSIEDPSLRGVISKHAAGLNHTISKHES